MKLHNTPFFLAKPQYVSFKRNGISLLIKVSTYYADYAKKLLGLMITDSQLCKIYNNIYVK